MTLSFHLANEGKCVTLIRFDWGSLNELFVSLTRGPVCRSSVSYLLVGATLPKEPLVSRWTGPSGNVHQAQVPLRELLLKAGYQGGALAFQFGEEFEIRMGVNQSRDIQNSVVVYSSKGLTRLANRRRRLEGKERGVLRSLLKRRV